MNQGNGRQSIFITGAASGMGRATAVLFAKRGWFVGAYDLSEAGLDSLKVEIGVENGVFEILDVTDPVAFAAGGGTIWRGDGGEARPAIQQCGHRDRRNVRRGRLGGHSEGC